MKIWSSEIKDLEKVSISLRGTQPELEKELERLIVADDENMLLVYSRRCLEVIITELCEKELNRKRGTEPLQRIIDKLNKEEKVPHNIIVSMLNVNSMSTFGAHPKEFDMKQIKPVLLYVTTVLEWYMEYSENQEIKTVKNEIKDSRLKYKKRNSVVKKKNLVLTGVLVVSAAIVFGLIFFDIIGGSKQASAKTIDSILILPFANYTGDETMDRKLDGLHLTLINEVQRLNGLHVINKTSSDVFKNGGMTIHEIASKMQVGAVIQPSVLCWGDSICMDLEMISGDLTEKKIWDGNYREDKSKLFTMYNKLTKQIAEEVNLKLTPAEESILAEVREVEPEALDAFLTGQSFWERLGGMAMDSAIYYFDITVEKDPDWAAPYAGLALAWMTRSGFDGSGGGAGEDLSQRETKIEQYIDKALELDPNSSEAYYVNAIQKVWGEWDYVTAEKDFKKALQLNPNHALCRMYYAHMLLILHRFEEARKQADLALRLDPDKSLILALNANLNFGFNNEEALANCKKAYKLDSNNVFNLIALAESYRITGDTLKWHELTKGLWNFHDHTYEAYIDSVYRKGGFIAVVKEVIKLYEEILKHGGKIPEMVHAEHYIWIDDYDKAMDYFEKAYENQNGLLNYLSVWYFVYPKLKDNPRYLALLKKMNLPIPK